jgi:predicted nuclease with TOPRIM domain
MIKHRFTMDFWGHSHIFGKMLAYKLSRKKLERKLEKLKGDYDNLNEKLLKQILLKLDRIEDLLKDIRDDLREIKKRWAR